MFHLDARSDVIIIVKLKSELVLVMMSFMLEKKNIIPDQSAISFFRIQGIFVPEDDYSSFH